MKCPVSHLKWSRNTLVKATIINHIRWTQAENKFNIYMSLWFIIVMFSIDTAKSLIHMCTYKGDFYTHACMYRCFFYINVRPWITPARCWSHPTHPWPTFFTNMTNSWENMKYISFEFVWGLHINGWIIKIR